MISTLLQFFAFQGTALIIEIPLMENSEINGAYIEWEDNQYELTLTEDNALVALIGIDLDTSAGSYIVPLSYVENENQFELEIFLEVGSWTFPTTELTVEPQYVSLSPENLERANRDSRLISEAYSIRSDINAWQNQFMVPLQGVSEGSNFGHRRVFNGEPRAPHSGADLASPTGTEIYASNAGQIVLAEDLFFSGQAVFIDHGSGIFTTYLHLSEILVEEGQMVEKGELIGLVGATGRVTGPHLHWGARIGTARVDPFSLVAN